MKCAKSDTRFVRFRPGKVAKWFTIYYFQNTSVVGKKLKELKDSVYHLTVVIVETFTPNDKNGGDEVIVKAAKSIEGNVKGLFR